MVVLVSYFSYIIVIIILLSFIVSSESPDECSPGNATSCGEDYVCVAEGIGGLFTCVRRKSFYFATWLFAMTTIMHRCCQRRRMQC